MAFQVPQLSQEELLSFQEAHFNPQSIAKFDAEFFPSADTVAAAWDAAAETAAKTAAEKEALGEKVAAVAAKPGSWGDVSWDKHVDCWGDHHACKWTSNDHPEPNHPEPNEDRYDSYVEDRYEGYVDEDDCYVNEDCYLEEYYTTEEEEASGVDDEEDDDLGYYSDGVKRTLTDEQIAIFRHSELERLRRAKEAEEDKAANTSRKRTAEEALSPAADAAPAPAAEDGEIPDNVSEEGELEGPAPKKRKKNRRKKARTRADGQVIDLRKRTWDVVETGLETLDYEEEGGGNASGAPLKRQKVSYDD